MKNKCFSLTSMKIHGKSKNNKNNENQKTLKSKQNQLVFIKIDTKMKHLQKSMKTYTSSTVAPLIPSSNEASAAEAIAFK